MLKCDICSKQILASDVVYTAVGVIQCKDCDTKRAGTVSLDDVLNKIIKTKEQMGRD